MRGRPIFRAVRSAKSDGLITFIIAFIIPSNLSGLRPPENQVAVRIACVQEIDDFERETDDSSIENDEKTLFLTETPIHPKLTRTPHSLFRGRSTNAHRRPLPPLRLRRLQKVNRKSRHADQS